MSNQADHTIVRLRVPPELKKQIENAAEKNNRSQSAEMVARLEQSFNTSVIQPEDLKESFEQLLLETKRNLAIQEELVKTNGMLLQLLNKKIPKKPT